MGPNITVKKDYILVEPQAVEFQAIIDAIAKLFSLPEYPGKNVIWLIGDGFSRITYDELIQIRDFIIKHLPENVGNDHKTAVVLTSGFLAGMAQVFDSIAGGFSLKYRIFSDLNSAEDWVIDA